MYILYLDFVDVLFVDLHLKGEGGHVVENSQGAAGGGEAVVVNGVPQLKVLFNDGARDGGGDGVVVQSILGVLQRELSVL